MGLLDHTSQLAKSYTTCFLKATYRRQFTNMQVQSAMCLFVVTF